MQADAATLNTLKTLLLSTLDPNPQVRRRAEEELKTAETRPGLSVVLLKVLDEGDQGAVTQCAAVYFKNFLKRNWKGDSDRKENEIPINDKEAIKKHIVTLMCNVNPRLQRQLTEVVRIIGEHDFPDNWQNLLPDLVTRLVNFTDFRVLHGLLETANTLFKMFRDKPASDPLWLKLKYVLGQFEKPLMALYQKVSEMVDKSQNDKQALVACFTALRLMTRIFYSLNWQTIPEFFEDNIAVWMGLFHKYLTYTNPLITTPDDEDTPGPIESLQSAIINNLRLYADKYEEEFQSYLQQFTTDTWNLLLTTKTTTNYDTLVTTAMGFLSTLVGKAMHKDLFSANGVLQSICEKIVIPNLMLRDSDLETFEDNPLEYIRGDIEGSDREGRRNTACELVQSMCRNFEEPVTQLCLGFMGQLITQYNSNKAQNWRSKDAALTLMIALSSRRSTVQHGVTEVNDKVSVVDFYNQFVLGELQEMQGPPLMKADALKYVTTFRNQLPKEIVKAALPLIVNLLKSDSFVVHTYAATAIDRLFVIRDNVNNNLQFRYTYVDLQPVLDGAFTNLFSILEKSTTTENEYVIKAVMRVIVTTKEEISKVTGVVVEKLSVILLRVCTNPQNPVFNHFLFECIAAVVQFVCAKQPALVAQFESRLFPPFQQVLAAEVTELTPYIFQIMAQMLELTPGEISQGYLSLFQALLHPSLWDNRGTAPVLVRLIEAYLRKSAATLLNTPQRIEAILGVFQKLLASKSTEEYAFKLLVGVVEFVEPEKYATHLVVLFKLIFTKLQSNKSAAFAKSLVHFLSVFVGKHGPEPVVKSIENLGQGLFWQILNQVWLVTMPKIGQRMDIKACAIASTRLLTTLQPLHTAQRSLGLSLFRSIIILYENPTQNNSTQPTPEEALIVLAESGYSSGYSRLAYAMTEVRDSFMSVKDGREYLVKGLLEWSQREPGVVTPFLNEAFGQDEEGVRLKTAFGKYMAAANVSQFQ